MILRGKVEPGFQHFTRRMTTFPEVFASVSGQSLYPGTINVRVDRLVPIVEDFRIEGSLIGEPDQDLLFEPCRINGYDAFRIRPYQLASGEGGHGDNILEISCSVKIPGIEAGSDAAIELFRDEV